MAMTLALTVIVPETVVPRLGEVIVTMRLPVPGSGSPRACGVEIQEQLRNVASAVTVKALLQLE
jgi:hypothetical protein